MGPLQRVWGPMSLVVNLYHACENAVSKASLSLANILTSSLYFESWRSATSLVSIPTAGFSRPGWTGFDKICFALSSASFHWYFPPGPLNLYHLFSDSTLKKLLSHFTGFGVHGSSKPLVKASFPFPDPQAPFQKSNNNNHC